MTVLESDDKRSSARRRFWMPRRSGAGFSREKGLLCLFTCDAILVLRPGPKPAASIRTAATGRWNGCRGDDRLFSFKRAIAQTRQFYEQRRKVVLGAGGAELFPSASVVAIASFLERIDPRHRAQLADFQHHSWELYTAICRAPGVAELLAENVGLAVCLANFAALAPHPGQHPLRAVRRLLGKRRRTIAASLGWPDREAAVRLLAKVEPEAAQLTNLRALRELAHDPRWLRRLSHLPRIDEDIARLIAHDVTREQCTQGLLLELAQPATRPSILPLIERLNLNMARANRPAPPLRSIEHAMTLSDRADDLVSPRRRRRMLTFGLAPVPGTPTIVPLRSSKALDEEAKEQCNCSANGTFDEEVAAGRVYLYRILAPERATLSVCLDEDTQRWRIADLRTRANGRPLPGTVRVVGDWLAGQGDRDQGDRDQGDRDHSGDAIVAPQQLSAAVRNCNLRG